MENLIKLQGKYFIDEIDTELLDEWDDVREHSKELSDGSVVICYYDCDNAYIVTAALIGIDYGHNNINACRSVLEEVENLRISEQENEWDFYTEADYKYELQRDNQ